MTTIFADGDRFELRTDLVVEQVDDEVIVLDLAGNKYFGLNEVAWLIWQSIDGDGGETLKNLVAQIVESFGISEAEARTDVEAFVEQLVEAGLAEYFAQESSG